MRIVKLTGITAGLLAGFFVVGTAHADCYPKPLVDGLVNDLNTGHAALVEDRGFYQVGDVNALPLAMQNGLAGQSTACPPPDQPPGPISDTDAAPNEVAEDAAIGTAVGYTALSVDPDGDTVTYSLSDDAGGRFAIDAVTGVVTVAGGLDFETATSHQITIVATALALTSQANATVNVLDVVEPTITLVKLFEVLQPLVARVQLPGGGETLVNHNNLSPSTQTAGTLSADKKNIHGIVLFEGDPQLQTEEGTYILHWWAKHHRETTFFSQEIDINGNFVSPRLDFQYGGGNNPLGTAVWTTHLRRGSFEDENSTTRIHMACQWNMIALSWKAGEPTVMYYNGIRLTHEHTNAQGQELANAILGINAGVDELKSNGRWHIHHFNNAGDIREMVFSARRLTDQEIADIHASLYADEIAAGRHVPGGSPNATTPANFHGPGQPFTGADIPASQDPITDGNNVKCTNLFPTTNTPKSVDDVQLGSIIGGGGTDVGELPSEGGGTDPVPVPTPGPSPSGGLPNLAVVGDGLATFGMALAPGDLPAGMALAHGGNAVQTDVKARHADGSARHVIVTAPADTGPLAAVQAGQCEPLTAAADWQLTVAVNGLRADVPAMVRANPTDRFLSCPLASQYRVFKDGPGLRVTADVTVYADGAIRTDVILDSAAANDNQSLDVKISQDGALVYAREQSQWPRTMWRKTVWRGTKPTAYPVRDPAYVVRTGATPRYDTAIDPDIGGPLKRAASVAGGIGPMQSPLNKHDMRTTGQTSNRHVGLMTIDQVMYLLSQDPRVLDAVVAYSEGAASIGWHGRKNGEFAPLGLIKTGDWKVDQAHQPAFHYAAYLWTGDRYHLDLLHHQTGSSIIDRDGDLLVGQPRATAWRIRNLANAAYITPDGHPLKDYFAGHLTRTMKQWYADYVLDGRGVSASGELAGFHVRCMTRSSDRGKVSPWMDDYITLVVAWVAEQGVPLARQVLQHRANFTLGRFEDHPGWNPRQGVAYRLGVMDRETCRPSKSVSTWADVWSKPSLPNEGARAHRAGHYFDLAFGAVSAVDNVLRSERSARALAFMRSWANEAGGRVFKERRGNPKWAIAGTS